MSTVACNTRMMAADSMAISGNTVREAVKVFRVALDDGRAAIVGFAGVLEDGIRFVHWLQATSSQPDNLGEDFVALVLTNGGTITRYEQKCVEMPVLESYTAIGSGRDFAIAAMALGKTPAEAIELACRFDAFTGLPVRVEELT